MSLHRSFGKTKHLGGSRNVLKLVEKIKYFIAKGEWEVGDEVFGLKKIKIFKLKKIKVEKKEKEEEQTNFEGFKKEAK